MVFSDLFFLFGFLPLFALCYLVMAGIDRRRNRSDAQREPFRLRNAALVVFSLAFYALGEPVYVLLMLASVVVNYFVGLAIGRNSQRRRKTALVVGLAFNILVLAVFTAIFPDLVLRIYTDDLNLVAAAIPSIYVICVATILGSVGVIYFEAISGTGNTSAAMALEFGVLIAYMFYIYLTTRVSTIAVVWTAEWFYNIIIGFISFCYIWKADWRKRAI